MSSGQITQLPPIDSDGPGGAAHHGGADHPMRTITRQIAFDGRWDAKMRAEVTELFTQLAPQWDESRRTPERVAALDDAFIRTDLSMSNARCLELGAGTGIFSHALAERCGRVTSVDITAAMVSQVNPDDADRVVGDGSGLPFSDDCFACAVLVNMFLFAAELDRVVAPGGSVVWFNSRGEHTPIHLTTREVADALPGVWSGYESRRGTATWAVLTRDS